MALEWYAPKLRLNRNLADFSVEALTLVLGEGMAWHFDGLEVNRSGHDHVRVA
jgi:hypothetical protein